MEVERGRGIKILLKRSVLNGITGPIGAYQA